VLPVSLWLVLFVPVCLSFRFFALLPLAFFFPFIPPPPLTFYLQALETLCPPLWAGIWERERAKDRETGLVEILPAYAASTYFLALSSALLLRKL